MISLALAAGALAAPPVQTVEAPGYANRIADRTLVAPFTEICFKGGAEQTDLHPAGGSTAGGNCAAGDLGFLIETVPRGNEGWINAIAVCASEGLRLPEPWEIGYACYNATAIGFAAQTDVKSWAGNRPYIYDDASLAYSREQAFFANNGCDNSSNWYTIFGATPIAEPFLCAL